EPGSACNRGAKARRSESGDTEQGTVMTGKEICEKASRMTWPELPDAAHEDIGGAIWGAARDGSLWHVQALAGDIEHQPENVPTIVRCMNGVKEAYERHAKTGIN